jgi:hypothetical protein
MSLIVERRRRVLDLRSVIIAVVVLLVGAGLGFAVGYEVKAHRTSSTSSASKPATSAPAKSAGSQAATPAQTAGIAKFRSCLDSHGLKYPPISGGEKAFALQIAKPPTGVSQATYEAALRACYAANARPKAG